MNLHGRPAGGVCTQEGSCINDPINTEDVRITDHSRGRHWLTAHLWRAELQQKHPGTRIKDDVNPQRFDLVTCNHHVFSF